MTTIILLTPYLAMLLGTTMIARALQLSQPRPQSTGLRDGRALLLLCGVLAVPSLASAQGVDLKTATESGNAIIMYLCGTFAAIGIVTAGVAMMGGRPAVAKWAFAGAMVCGLAFAIVRSMWSNMGLEAANVGTFGQ